MFGGVAWRFEVIDGILFGEKRVNGLERFQFIGAMDY